MPDSRITFTPNLHLTKLPANFHVWAQIMNDNLTMVDAAVSGFIVFQGLRGPWTNSTLYIVGDTVVDPLTAVIWQCHVAHTSASIPTTFLEDRTARPSYWSVYSSAATARGQWTGPGTAYALNDFVVNGLQYAVCIAAHTSTASFANDVAAGMWSVLIDLNSVGTALLPAPGGLPDANKFALTNSGGTGYGIFSPDYALSIMGATSIGTALLRSTSQADARNTIGAAPAVGGGYLPLSGGNLVGPLVGTTADFSGAVKAMNATAIPVGGTSGAGVLLSSAANFGVIFGSGAPSVSMARGSMYLRSDGSPYVNTDGSTTWAPLGGSVSVGTSPPASPSDGQLWYYNDASSGGGALYIRYNDGDTTQWVPASPAATPGSLLQTVFTEIGALATGTTQIPGDDTIPQITEGDQYMTLAITRMSATSRLIIEVVAHLSTSAANASLVAALFQDSTANALAMGFSTQASAGFVNQISFRHVMISGTTGTTTFRVRGGSNGVGTTSFNGISGTRFYGGVIASSIVIQEVA